MARSSATGLLPLLAALLLSVCSTFVQRTMVTVERQMIVTIAQ